MAVVGEELVGPRWQPSAAILQADEGDMGALALEHQGYAARPGMVFYQKHEPVGPGSAGVLGQLGGRMVRAGAWDQLGGMAREKELIGRRVILPLAQPQLAERLGLVPPRAVVLFGPPERARPASPGESRRGWRGRLSSCFLQAGG